VRTTPIDQYFLGVHLRTTPFHQYYMGVGFFDFSRILQKVRTTPFHQYYMGVGLFKKLIKVRWG
jgi:hypothetical protein